MAFLDKFKKVYTCSTFCYNCGTLQDCRIPKGITIDAFLKTEAAVCVNCANPTLRRVENIKPPAGVREPFKETRVSQLPMRKMAVSQRGQPSPPSNQISPHKVDYPIERPVYDDEKPKSDNEWALRPKRVNMWTGKEE